jgi:hypothetical protein
MVHRTARTLVDFDGALSTLEIVDTPTIRQRFDGANRPAQPSHTLVAAVALAIERLLAMRGSDFSTTVDTAAAAGTVHDLADIVGRTLVQLGAIRSCQGCRADWGIHASAAAEALGAPPDFPAPAGPARCVRLGRKWRLDLGHRSVVVEHSVGMAHLAALIANPGAEIHAADLVAGVGALNHEAPAADSSAQSVLDDVARQQYRRRLSRLDTEIAEAEAGHRPGVGRIRAERDWLAAQLTANTGLSGRPRGFTDNAERARLAVGKAIRRAISRIGAADALLGEHLRKQVHTGMRCSYLFLSSHTG